MSCKGLSKTDCLTLDNCKYVETTKRTYCRTRKNKKKTRTKTPTKSKTPTPTINITNYDEYIYISNASFSDKPIAGFDLDYTLIKPKSGKLFAKNKDDWHFLFDNVVSYLQSIAPTYNIVIFTNQNGIKKEAKREMFLAKIVQIIEAIQLPIHIYASKTNGFMRKPLTGLWETCLSNIKSIHTNHFYCGDAAGRPDDFAATDLMFANNNNITFLLPEEVFKEEKSDIEYSWPEYLTQYSGSSAKLTFEVDGPTLLLMCGYPGCGKSTIVNTLDGFTAVSNDTLGTKAKCIKATKELLLKNKNIVVDNTNLSLANRIEYYKLAREWIVSKKGNPYNIIVIHINNNIQFCYYMNQLRCQLSKGVQKLVPKIAYHTLKKRAEFPALSEYDNIKIITHSSMVDEYIYQFPPL